MQCPRCGSTKFWRLRTGQRRCTKCRLTRKFGRTRWQKARISPYWKGRLVEFFCLGVPAYRLRFQVPLDQKTVQRWYRILRETIWEKALREASALEGAIELDEALFGGRSHGKRGWGAVSNKHMVFGIYQRDGKVITFPVSSRSSKDLVPLILKHTKPGSLFYTDDWHAYTFLPVRGDHVVIQKEKGRAKGRNHINGIEGFWSYAKHWLYHYRGVPKTYFPLYLKEVEWRFNHRNQNLVTLLRTYLHMPVTSPSGA
jgi:transposase